VPRNRLTTAVRFVPLRSGKISLQEPNRARMPERKLDRLEPAFAFGEARRLNPVARPELLDRGGEVVALGALGEVELGCYVPYPLCAGRTSW
jgi:hypothetical protein